MPDTSSWLASSVLAADGERLHVELDESFAIATDGCDGVFLSVDIDVCDPGHAPGTGTRNTVHRGPRRDLVGELAKLPRTPLLVAWSCSWRLAPICERSRR